MLHLDVTDISYKSHSLIIPILPPEHTVLCCSLHFYQCSFPTSVNGDKETRRQAATFISIMPSYINWEGRRGLASFKILGATTRSLDVFNKSLKLNINSDRSLFERLLNEEP